MGAASQVVIDAAAQAIAQETLDRRHAWRQMFAVKHGLPDVERNIIKITEPAYYDRVIEAPVNIVGDAISLEELKKLRGQEPRIEESKVQDSKFQETRIETPRIETPRIQDSKSQDPRIQESKSQEAPSTLKKALIGLASAGAIGASGLAGYLINKPKEPTVTTAPVDGDLLQELRKRGYHLRRTE